MLYLNFKNISKTSPAETNKTNNQINKMVYKLYGLSEEEIAVVEGI